MAQQEHRIFDNIDHGDDVIDDDIVDHPIFCDIEHGNLEAVQQRVLADATVLDDRESNGRNTPLMWAIIQVQAVTALWLLEHRGQHDVDTSDEIGWTALHWASVRSQLQVLQALVAAGTKPVALDGLSCTPLKASCNGHTDVVAFLLQLPVVKASIDHVDRNQWTALFYASSYGHHSIVQLVLDAGADPTIPAGQRSPLNRAITRNHPAIAALLRRPIAKAERARALHKAHSQLSAGTAAPACLQGRMEQGQALPQVKFLWRGRSTDEKLRAATAFAVGVSGGEKDTGLCKKLYVELLGYMLPAWADKGPAEV